MVRGRSYLAELVRINDTLIWSHDRTDSYLAAVEIVREVTGARIAPTYLLDKPGDLLVLTADEDERAELGEAFATMPAHEHVRSPWLNPQEWPVSAADHQDSEAWAALPEDFRRWFGPWGVIVSIHADGRHLGAVLLCFDHPYRLTRQRAEFLAAVGRILGSALYRWQIAGRERELGALEERRRLGDELHVDLSQQVATLGLHVGSMRLDAADGDLPRLVDDVGRLDELVVGLKGSLRHQMLGLRADASLVEGGFLEQVRTHVETFRRQFGIDVRLECTGECGDDVAPLPVAAQLLRVLQEALANVHLHACARSVVVRVHPTSTHVRLEVEDDGNGFDPTSVPDSRLGVAIMRERMAQVDGSVRFTQGGAGGTLVVAEAPLRWHAAAPQVQVGSASV
ncbi:sensor histidine kinase [Cellulomonas citrea]|uniref:sensor histidine kinase n=1 Tax=Cellulomonas citrea TaxID=1909423 RepID=UPI001358A6BD|nr:ATP-binding protein [Cellulomonas citrea]